MRKPRTHEVGRGRGSRSQRRGAPELLRRGISLVEVVIATALITLSLTGLASAYAVYLRAGLNNTEKLQAAFLLVEGIEALTLIRNSGWTNLSALAPGTPYFLAWNGSGWSATADEALIDGVFRRTFVLGDVYRRDADDDIVHASSPAAKTLDPNTKKIEVFVTWETAGTGTTSAAAYLANMFE